MLAGVQPFRAPDTRRLELRIRSQDPPEPLGASCPWALRAVVAKLLARRPVDRYADGRAIREDLERVLSGRTTQAEHEGWPADRAPDDEPPTARPRPPAHAGEDATRVLPRVGAEPSAAALSATHVFLRAAELHPTAKRRRPAARFVAVAFLLPAFFVLGHELVIALRAERLKADVPAAELHDIGGMWESYHALGSQSLRLTTASLKDALTRRTIMLGDRIIGDYRLPAPTVRETQWKMARAAFEEALAVSPGDAEIKGALRYCEGHLHRINGEARKARQQNAEAQREFTEAVSAFRDAARLRPAWPDPFLGLMRTFVYGFDDVERAADALKQAQHLGYTAGDRETVQLADGYRSRAMVFARSARARSGMAAQQDLALSAEAYRQAIALYSRALGYAGAKERLRAAQHGLEHAELRRTASSAPPGRPRTVRPFRAVGPRVVVPQ
jgi:hypothetical protein